MSVQLLSSEKLNEKLLELFYCLTSLPTTLPYSNQYYNFIHFAPDPDDVELYGSIDAAVNRALEVSFCPQGRADSIQLKERGPGLVAIVEVLRKYNKDFPSNAVLQKWVWDLLDSAQKAGGTPTKPIGPAPIPTQKATEIGEKRKAPDQGPDQRKKPTLVPTSVLDRYVDLDPAVEDFKKGRGGRKQDPLVKRLVVPCYRKNDLTKKKLYRCTGAVYGCEKIWLDASGWRERFLKHAATCRYLSSELRQEVNSALGNQALGFTSLTPSSNNSANSAPILQVPSRSSTNNSTIVNWTRAAGHADLVKKINFHVLKLLCIRGLPPRVVDSPEWKDLMGILAPQYQPTTSKTFADSLIPREYAFIKNKQFEHLKGCKNLTISFDGGTTAALQSVYTVHIITLERRIFLFEGSQASDQSHTASHIFSVLDSVLKAIGTSLFRGITSDNTGNTSAARNLIRDKYPWIIILPDPCHRLNLLCKDIGRLPQFKVIIKQIQRVVKFFRKSTYGATHLKKKRHELGISCGIKSVGKTRFGSVYFSALSVEQNYAAVVELCKLKTINIPDVNHLFIPGLPATQFTCALQQLITVLAPIAKSITCLESTHSTVADVYYFWLAVSAEIHRMLTEDGLPTNVKEEIRLAVNYRFNQMVNDAPSDVFLTGFILDPRFRGADIFQDLNPLAIRKLKIPTRNDEGRLEFSKLKSADPSVPDSLRRAGNFLLGMLRAHYKDIGELIAGLSTKEAVAQLKEQVVKYQKGVYPFDRPFNEKSTAENWWTKLDMDPSQDAQPLANLACTIFQLLPNSMADERTESTFKWLNSPLRNRQEVDTLVRMTTIRQWYLYNPEKKPEPFRPSVRFRDMSDMIFGSKSTRSPPVQLKEDTETSVDDFGDDSEDIEEIDLNMNGDIMKDDIVMFSRNNLDVESQVNLSSPMLLDLLAENSVFTAKNNENQDKKITGRNEMDLDNTTNDLDDEDMWNMD